MQKYYKAKVFGEKIFDKISEMAGDTSFSFLVFGEKARVYFIRG